MFDLGLGGPGVIRAGLGGKGVNSGKRHFFLEKERKAAVEQREEANSGGRQRRGVSLLKPKL